jgi:hypothetical protein
MRGKLTSVTGHSREAKARPLVTAGLQKLWGPAGRWREKKASYVGGVQDQSVFADLAMTNGPSSQSTGDPLILRFTWDSRHEKPKKG